MKKLFTFALLALLSVGANAQDRKTWDFTKGFSTTTIANLKSAGWTDETAGRSIQCGARSSSGELKYEIDGVEWTVPETAGLSFAAKSAKHIVFAYDYNNTGFKGKSFLWINGKKSEDAITVPNIPAGEKVTVTYESHSTTDNRGFKTSGDFKDAEGNQTFTSHGDTVTVVIYNTGSETQDMKMQSTNGHHIYKIVIGEGDVVENAKIAYLYNETKGAVAAQLEAREGVDVVAIDVASTTIDASGLQEYTLVVIDANVPADNAAVNVVKEALPFTPTLNFNANLYPAWGYGTAVSIVDGIGAVKNAKSSLLADVPIEQETLENGVFSYVDLSASSITGVTLGDYFAGDDTILVESREDLEAPAVIAHLHNNGHNSYIYMPYGETEPAAKLIDNAINILAASKSEVGEAPSPGIRFEYKDKSTIITLVPSTLLNKAHVYYTLDGTDPTTESTEYTAPFTVTEVCTIKAVAIGEGYLLSKVNSAEVAIKEQPKTPVISAEYAEGKTTVTIECESANETTPIYYSFTETTDLAAVSKYTEPIVLTEPRDIYAFAVADASVWSEMAHERVLVKDAIVEVDVVGHFGVGSNWVKVTVAGDGSTTESTLSNNGSLFSGSMNSASSMYDTSDETKKIVSYDGEGNEVVTWPEVAWMTLDEPGETPQWMVMSKGEVVLYQTNSPSESNFGDDDGINPATVSDVNPYFKATKNNLHFYKCYTGEPQNAAIQSKVTFQAPFTVAVITCLNGGASLVQVSADGETWEQVGDTITQSSSNSRMWNLITRRFAGDGQYYVRLAAVGGNVSAGHKVYDIYVANSGETSAQLKADYDKEYNDLATGITDMKPATRGTQAIFNLNGVRQQRLQRGLNIVVMGDGAVRKVVVK